MKGLYKLNVDCGRNGELDGVFVEEKDMVDILIKERLEVYFGEVLGKHSEIYGSLNEDDITFITDDAAVIEVVEKYKLTSGYNPFHYPLYGDDQCKTIGEVCKALLSKEAK